MPTTTVWQCGAYHQAKPFIVWISFYGIDDKFKQMTNKCVRLFKRLSAMFNFHKSRAVSPTRWVWLSWSDVLTTCRPVNDFAAGQQSAVCRKLTQTPVTGNGIAHRPEAHFNFSASINICLWVGRQLKYPVLTINSYRLFKSRHECGRTHWSSVSRSTISNFKPLPSSRTHPKSAKKSPHKMRSKVSQSVDPTNIIDVPVIIDEIFAREIHLHANCRINSEIY